MKRDTYLRLQEAIDILIDIILFEKADHAQKRKNFKIVKFNSKKNKKD